MEMATHNKPTNHPVAPNPRRRQVKQAAMRYQRQPVEQQEIGAESPSLPEARDPRPYSWIELHHLRPPLPGSSSYFLKPRESCAF